MKFEDNSSPVIPLRRHIRVDCQPIRKQETCFSHVKLKRNKEELLLRKTTFTIEFLEKTKIDHHHHKIECVFLQMKKVYLKSNVYSFNVTKPLACSLLKRYIFNWNSKRPTTFQKWFII
uniref:Uncharacterized protein n=1 Tax=Cacopsylla melanoneura TaxID=428564 RepID=A0A8D8TZ64_9HEMI